MIRVQAAVFDPGAELAEFGRSLGHDTGGIASFTGLVRDGGGLVALTLEHYPGMTERQLEKIEAEAQQRWPLTGTLPVRRRLTMPSSANSRSCWVSTFCEMPGITRRSPAKWRGASASQ